MFDVICAGWTAGNLSSSIISFTLFVIILIETEVTQRNHVFFTCYSDLIWALFFENNVKWCVSGLIGIYSEFTGRGVGENDRTGKP